MGKIRVGLSGWSYEEWRGPFYPGDLPRGGELEYVSRRFGTVEVNGTFYGLANPEMAHTPPATPLDSSNSWDSWGFPLGFGGSALG